FDAKLDSRIGTDGNYNVVNNGVMVYFAKDTDRNGIALMKAINSTNDLVFIVNESENTLSVPTSINLDEWHHYSLVISPSQILLYIDGDLQVVSELTAPLDLSVANPYSLHLARLGSDWYPSNISMDNFRWYPVAHHGDTINEIYGDHYHVTHVTSSTSKGKAGDTIPIQVHFNKAVSI